MINFINCCIFAAFLASYETYALTPVLFNKTCGGEYELSFFSDMRYYVGAKGACETYGGSLVRIRNAQMQAAIENAVPVAKYYIDGYDENKDNAFNWSDGGEVPVRGAIKYQKWDAKGDGQPNNNDEQCMIIGEHGKMNWFDAWCNVQYRYICQRGSNYVMTMTNITTIATCRSTLTTMRWEKNSVVVQSTDTSLVYQTIRNPGSESVATLNFANPNIAEAGIYTCVSTSPHCTVQRTVTVNAEGKPTIMNITNNKCNSSLLVTWKPSKAAVGFPHKIKTTTSKKEFFVIPESDEIQRATIDGLDLDTVYTIKIKACLAENLCSTGFQVQQQTTTNGITKPVTGAVLKKLNNEECKALWTSPDRSAAFQLQANCTTAKFRSPGDRQTITNKTEGIILSNFTFKPQPNRRCTVAIKAKGCGLISTQVIATGICVTSLKEPEFIEPPVVEDMLNETSKTIRITKPREENGLISCIFVIFCHCNCRSHLYDLNNLIEANGTGVEEDRDMIAAAIAMSINGSSNISLEFSRGDVTCCDIYNTGLESSSLTNGTICGKAKISDTLAAVKVFVITSTPSESAILLKSSETRILVEEKTTISLLTTKELTTLPSKETTTKELTTLPPKETTSQSTTQPLKDNNNELSDNLPIWIAGPIAGVVVLIVVAVIATVVIRRRKSQRKNIDGEAEPQVRFSPNQVPSQQGEENPIQISNDEEIPYENARRDRQPPPEEDAGSKISVAGVESSYNSKRENNNAGFTKEYNDILQEVGKITKTTEVASTPALVKKNRYKNILPYDENRVQLKAGNEYINASYINDSDRVTDTSLLKGH